MKPSIFTRLLLVWIILLCASSAPLSVQAISSLPPTGPLLANPILFVTQPPVRADFTTIGSTFGNHGAAMQAVARGGDLWIRYPDGTLKNLTAAAGYGSTAADGFQGDDAIAVRDPSVHWGGQRALFSMVIGGPTRQFEYEEYYWQLYEITGLGPNDTPVIHRVANQPADFNNVSPLYGTDDRILFTSDRPRNGERHLYPQLDEYELAPTVTGLWSLDPVSGDLHLLNHAPSGDFTPTLDSFGRLLFTQWDHLQRDQQADTDALSADGPVYGTFDYTSESALAAIAAERIEIFPEPRGERTDLLAGSNLVGHSFNHFFPWMIMQDGRESEVLNHLGRHELHDYIPASLTGDANISDYSGQTSRFNPNPIENMFQIEEDPNHPGLYYGVDAPEFATHASGQIIRLAAPPQADADHIQVDYITHRDTASTADTPEHTGHYREPLPLADGVLIAVHTATKGEESSDGPPLNSTYDFRLKTLVQNGVYFVADQPLTPGITKTLRYWSPDEEIRFTGQLWELNPVEVRVRPRPPVPIPPLPGPESRVFAQVGVDVQDFQAYLRSRNLALIVSRNVTVRDDLDRQQPFNLRVAGSDTQTIGAPGIIYDVARLDLFQADQVRGWTGGGDTPRPGRRVLARALHDPAALAANIPGDGPGYTVPIAADGSMAALVPARRALTWQLSDPKGIGVVRERYWLTFQPGEVRVCAACHGLSDRDQAGATLPTNEPQALRALLEAWKAQQASLTERVYLPLVER